MMRQSVCCLSLLYRAFLPLLLACICLSGSQYARATTTSIDYVSAVFKTRTSYPQGNDSVSWSFNANWDTAVHSTAYCNYSLSLIARYYDDNGNPVTIGYGIYERSWAVSSAGGTMYSPGTGTVSGIDGLYALSLATSNAPLNSHKTEYFYRLVITVADGYEVYASASQDSNHGSAYVNGSP